MDAAALLEAYRRLHDARDWAALAALFAPDGELAFQGLDVPAARGPAAIERRFRERGPDDGLVLWPTIPQGPGRVSAVYGWKRAPASAAGTLWLTAAGDRI